MESLAELFQAKQVEKEFKTSKFNFKLRTLSAEELTEVFRRADSIAMSIETKALVVKRFTLAYALTSINGMDIATFPEVIELRNKDLNHVLTKEEALATLLGKFDDTVLDSLYTCYSAMRDEISAAREELKKA